MAHRATALAEWQFVDLFEPPNETEPLLAHLRAFCFPGGEDAARQIHAVRMTERGEMRSSPQARWLPFDSEQTIYATGSSFWWNSHFHTAKILPVTVTDAYEQHHGKLIAKVGPLTTQKVEGPDADKGELQRYLASFIYCPAMLLSHPSLEWTAAGPLTLRLSDRNDPTGATVDIEITDAGKPVACRADRPRMAGKRSILTPWMGIGSDFHEREGMRVPDRLEVFWLVSSGWFSYYRSQIASFTVAH